MILLFNKIIKKIRKNVSGIEVAFNLLKSNKDKITGKILVIDLKSKNSYGRYLINLMSFFAINGYHVIIKFRLKQVLNYGYYERFLTDKQNVHLAFSVPANTTYYISDYSTSDHSIHLARENYQIKNREQRVFNFPYSMHPLIFLKGHYKSLQSKGDKHFTHRKFRLSFAGNLSESMYKDIQLNGEVFINRNNLVNIIVENFSSELFVPKSREEYEEGSDKAICIVNRKYLSLSIEDYFELQRKSRFMLCPPGLQRPLCHNLVESIFNGAIPLLQYNHYMNPILENQKDCIVYQNEYDFIKKIEYVLTCSEDKASVMQQNVIDYYKQHLSPDAVISNFEKAVADGIKKITIPPTDHVFATSMNQKNQ